MLLVSLPILGRPHQELGEWFRCLPFAYRCIFQNQWQGRLFAIGIALDGELVGRNGQIMLL